MPTARRSSKCSKPTPTNIPWPSLSRSPSCRPCRPWSKVKSICLTLATKPRYNTSMGLFNNLVKLLEEDSESFDQRIVGALDRVEQVLGAGLDKAEEGFKKVEGAVGNVVDTAERGVQKIDKAGQKTKR